MELPQRKPTRLKAYDYSQNGAYFVTICTKNRRNILCDIVGGGAHDAPQVKLTEIGKRVEKYIISTNNIPDVTVDKYVIMPNHIHLILSIQRKIPQVPYGTSKAPSPTNISIPHAISTLKRFVNREIGKNIFQRSFHDHIIRNETDYLEIWQYIDNNPAQWQEDRLYMP